MVTAQRELAQRFAIVMAGRDIGTVVLPNAPVKIYLTASLPARIARRRIQLEAGRVLMSTRIVWLQRSMSATGSIKRGPFRRSGLRPTRTSSTRATSTPMGSSTRSSQSRNAPRLESAVLRFRESLGTNARAHPLAGARLRNAERARYRSADRRLQSRLVSRSAGAGVSRSPPHQLYGEEGALRSSGSRRHDPSARRVCRRSRRQCGGRD